MTERTSRSSEWRSTYSSTVRDVSSTRRGHSIALSFEEREISDIENTRGILNTMGEKAEFIRIPVAPDSVIPQTMPTEPERRIPSSDIYITLCEEADTYKIVRLTGSIPSLLIYFLT